MVKFQETQIVDNRLKAIFIILLLVFAALYIFIGEFFMTGVIICLIFTMLSLILRLDINIYNDRIEYRLYPFHVSSRIFMFNSIELIDVITIRHKFAYGFYGFKIKSNLIHSIYLFGGNNAIRIVKTGKKVIILSTQKANEVKQALEEIR